MNYDDQDLLGTQMVPRNFTQEVLAEIGRIVLNSVQGRPELAREVFNAVIPKFQNRYPHHKILSHFLLQEAFEREINGENLVADDSALPGPVELESPQTDT